MGPDGPLVEPHASRSSGPGSCSRRRSRSRSGWRSRCSRSGRCKRARAGASPRSPRSRWPRARSRSCSSSSSSPASRSRGARRCGGTGCRRRRRHRGSLEVVLWRDLPGRRALPVLALRSSRPASRSASRLRPDLACRERARPAVLLRGLPPRDRDALSHSVGRRRERRAPPLRGDSARRARLLAAPLAAAPLGVPSRARDRVERVAARVQPGGTAATRRRTRRLVDARSSSCAPPRRRRIASRRSTRHALSGGLSRGARRSRWRAAGTGRTTSRRTSCSTTSSGRGVPAWLRALGVRFVVLRTGRPTTARGARRRSCAAGARSAAGLPHEELTIYAVPHPRPIITGPGHRRSLHSPSEDRPGRSRGAARTGSPFAGRRTGTRRSAASPRAGTGCCG